MTIYIVVHTTCVCSCKTTCGRSTERQLKIREIPDELSIFTRAVGRGSCVFSLPARGAPMHRPRQLCAHARDARRHRATPHRLAPSHEAAALDGWTSQRCSELR